MCIRDRFAGVSFALGDSDLTPEGIEKATVELWKKGVTTYLPTLTTNSIEVLTRNFGLLSKAVDDEKLLGSIPGFHLEGPYINPEDGYRGAHPLKFVKLPDWDEFMKLHEASGRNILQITIAPEMEGALDLSLIHIYPFPKYALPIIPFFNSSIPFTTLG